MMGKTYKPRLVRDWQPRKPSRISMELRFPSVGKRVWADQQRQWLSANYPDCESESLALALNCDIQDITKEAKRMDLHKSADFTIWMKLSSLPRDPMCPPGFHWETEIERKRRMELRRQQDMECIKRMVKRFTFCTHDEKQQLMAAMCDAIAWARETELEQ